MNENIYYSVEDVTEDIKKNIGWRIQEKRLEKGITGADLGACLNISANQISRIERGCAGLDMVKLLVLSEELLALSDYLKIHLVIYLAIRRLKIKRRLKILKRE